MAIQWRQDARAVAEWIDSLPVEGPERDAIIEHPDPTYDGGMWWNVRRDCGCLVGGVVVALGGRATQGIPSMLRFGVWSHEEGARAAAAGAAFPRLSWPPGIASGQSITPERAWAWAKKRAARPYTNHIVVHTPERTPASVEG